MTQPTTKAFGVFTVREAAKKGERSFWTRIGTAFPHAQGEGFNVRLDALPVDGKLIILPPKQEPSKDDGPAPEA